MQPPLFNNLPHPSIHSGFNDGLPQIPSNFATVHPQTHPLNLSNQSDQSKHSQHTITTNSLSRTTHTPNTTTTSHITPPHNLIDPHNTNIEMPTTDVNQFTSNLCQNPPDMLDPDHVFTNPSIEHHDALQIYPSQPLIGDTQPIFDENERWTNTNFFSPGHEEIIGAWQTMFPLQSQIQTPPRMNNPTLSSPSPYKKARPAPLSIPPHSQAHTNLTAHFNDIGLRDPPVTYHASSAPSSAHLQQPQNMNINNHTNGAPIVNALPNLAEQQNVFYPPLQPPQPPPPPPAQNKYDVLLGDNVLFPNHSTMNIGLTSDPIIPNKPMTEGASLSAYPTRIAMPIVPSAYQNLEQSFWQKHRHNPSMCPVPDSKSGYLRSYTPYFAPNSAPALPQPPRMDINTTTNSHSNNNNNSNNMMRPQSASIQKPKGNPPFYAHPPPIVATPPTMVITVANRNANVFANSAVININNNNNNNYNNNNNNISIPAKRKRGRPRKYKTTQVTSNVYGKLLQTPSPKKRKVCKRSADRKNLEFIQYLKGDGTGPEMQIEDLSPQKTKTGEKGPHAKGFQRGGLRFNQNKNETYIRIVGGRDKAYKRPPADHRSYNRIRIWKDKLGRQFYDCICNARKPVQDLNKIKSHVLGHDKIVWVCDICGREFFNNHLQLNAHMKTHKKREIKASEQPIIK